MCGTKIMSESMTNNALEIIPTTASRYPKRRKFLRETTRNLSKPLSEHTDTNEEMEDTSIHFVEHFMNEKVVDQVANLLGSEEEESEEQEEEESEEQEEESEEQQEEESEEQEEEESEEEEEEEEESEKEEDDEEEEDNFNEDDGGQKSYASRKYRKCDEHKDECRDGNWSERDRQRLLVALRRFGVLNIPELMKAVPGKTESEIKEYIQMKWRSARAYLRTELKEKGMEGSIGPVDKWLNCLKDHFTKDFYKCTPLARAILFIWKFGDHPDPNECGGIDFKALYEHLYYLLCGFPPRELNRPTAMYLNCSLKLFSRQVKVDGWTDEKQLVSLVNVQKGVKKTKTDEDVIAALSYDSTKSFEELLKRPGFNPFAIPLDVFLNIDKSHTLDAENAETSVQLTNLVLLGMTT